MRLSAHCVAVAIWWSTTIQRDPCNASTIAQNIQIKNVFLSIRLSRLCDRGWNKWRNGIANGHSFHITSQRFLFVCLITVDRDGMMSMIIQMRNLRSSVNGVYCLLGDEYIDVLYDCLSCMVFPVDNYCIIKTISTAAVMCLQLTAARCGCCCDSLSWLRTYETSCRYYSYAWYPVLNIVKSYGLFHVLLYR